LGLPQDGRAELSKETISADTSLTLPQKRWLLTQRYWSLGGVRAEFGFSDIQAENALDAMVEEGLLYKNEEYRTSYSNGQKRVERSTVEYGETEAGELLGYRYLFESMCPAGQDIYAHYVYADSQQVKHKSYGKNQGALSQTLGIPRKEVSQGIKELRRHHLLELVSDNKFGTRYCLTYHGRHSAKVLQEAGVFG
jgi:hypothetical protein